MMKIKLILVVLSLFFLTGCEVYISNKENICFKYIDYNNQEHFFKTKYINSCDYEYGSMHCYLNNDHYVQVIEYERINCKDIKIGDDNG